MISVVVTHTTAGERRNQWEYVLSNFKPDQVYIYGSPGCSDVWSRYIKPVEISSVVELPGYPLVVLSPVTARNLPGEISLADLQHPSKCIYWFGSDSQNLEEVIFKHRKPDYLVHIPTDTKDQMYSWVSYGVTMWDRRFKDGNCRR